MNPHICRLQHKQNNIGNEPCKYFSNDMWRKLYAYLYIAELIGTPVHFVSEWNSMNSQNCQLSLLYKWSWVERDVLFWKLLKGISKSLLVAWLHHEKNCRLDIGRNRSKMSQIEVSVISARTSSPRKLVNHAKCLRDSTYYTFFMRKTFIRKPAWKTSKS